MPYTPTGALTELPAGHPCETCPVRAITICRSQTPEILADLRRLGTMQRLQAGQPIFHEGDPARRVFMVTFGSLKIYTLLGDGRRQVTGFMFPGDFLGISLDGEYAFTVEALEDAELWWFSRDAFARFVPTHTISDQQQRALRLAEQTSLMVERQTGLMNPHRFADIRD